MSAENIVPAAGLVARAPRPFPRMAALAAVIAASCALGGCATAIPLPSFMGKAGDDVVGSIRPVSPLSPALDPEDWRRAHGALAIALDPQGNGAPVNWDNPQTGAKGSFVPVGDARAVDDKICRAFISELGGKLSAQSVQGTACRDKSGEWIVGDVKPWKKT